MTYNRPYISIVIPVYNSAKYLQNTIDSIIRQTYSNFEIVIVDDGSTDNTRDFILSLKNDKIRYLYQDINSGGPSKPRNIGILESKGDLIALFDSDDIMVENKLSDAVRIFSDQTIDFIFTNFGTIDEHGLCISEDFLKDYKDFRKILVKINTNEYWYHLAGDVYFELLKANFIGTSSVVFRKSIIHDIGYFDEKLNHSEDIELWYRVAKSYKKMVFNNSVGHYYRKRKGSISNRGLTNLESIVSVWERQMNNAPTAEHVKIIQKHLAEAHIRYGWQASQLGNHQKANEQYRKSLTCKFSIIALRGYIANSIRGFRS